MQDTHSLSEWAAFLSLGVSGYAAMSVPYFVFVDADLEDFDPRPALARTAGSGRVDGLLVTVANARFDARQFTAETRESVAAVRHLTALSLRDAAISLAALLALLFPATGGTR